MQNQRSWTAKLVGEWWGNGCIRCKWYIFYTFYVAVGVGVGVAHFFWHPNEM